MDNSLQTIADVPCRKVVEHYPDKWYTVVAEVYEYRVNFKVYHISGLRDGITVGWPPIGSVCGGDWTDNIDNAEVYLHGRVKWDGCSDWHFDEQDRVMLHQCDRSGLVEMGEIMAICWDLAKREIANWHGWE